MSATDLMPSIHALPRREKFWIVQELLAELAHEEPFSESEYPVWSPYEAHSAAASLMQLLEQDKAQSARSKQFVFNTLMLIRVGRE